MSLIVKIGADIRSFDREMKKLTGDINRISGKMKDIGTSMTQSLTLPIAAIGGFAIKTGMDFESAMSQVKAASGASGKELQALEDIARELGASTKYSGTEAALGLTELLKAGQNTKQAMDSIPGVLSLASAGELEVADAAAIATAALSQFGLKANQTDRIGNVLAKTANATTTSVQELGAALITAGPAGASAGMSFEEVNAILGIFANRGVVGALAGEKLKQVVNRLANASGPGAKALAELGVSIYDSEGNMRSMIDIIADLESKTKNLTQEQRNHYLSTIFGADAVAAANQLLDVGADKIKEFANELADSNGYADEFAATLNDNFAGRVEAMMGDLEEVGITIYKALLPALEALVAGVSKLAEWFANLSPQAQMFIIALGGILAAAGPLLVAVAMLIKAFGIVKGAIMAVQVATWGAIGVWVAVGIAIAALVALIIIYWDEIVAATKATWEWIKKFLSALWDGIVSVAKSIWGPISDFFSGLWEGIKSLTVTVWNGIKDFFSEWGLTILAVITGPIGWLVGLIVKYWDEIKAATTVAWEVIKSFLASIWNGIVAIFSPIFNGILTVITTIWNGISIVTSAVWNYITQYLKAIWDALMYFAKPVFDSIANFVKSVWENIQNISSTVWNAIKSFLSTIWNEIKSIATTVWDAIKSFFTTWLNNVKSTMSTVWDAIKSAVSTVWNSIKSTATSVWDAIKNAVMGPINQLKSMATSVFNVLKSSVSSIFNSIKSTALSIWNSIYSSVTSKVRSLVSGVTGAFNGLKSAVVGVWNGIKSGIKTVINGIISMINKFINGFNKPAELLNKIPGVDAPKIPNIPMLATGGTIFGSGMAIVGEAGPELVQKSGSSVKVTPLSSQERAQGIGGALGGGFQGTIEVPVNIDGKQVARVVAPFMDSELRGRLDSKNRARGGW